MPRTDDSVRNRWQRLLRKQEKPRFQARRTDGDGPPAVEEAGVDDGGGGGGEDASGLRHGDMWTAEEDEMIDRGVRLDSGKPGTGLGLAIVRDVAEIYGGTVTLEESEDLGGLLVRLRLPAA